MSAYLFLQIVRVSLEDLLFRVLSILPDIVGAIIIIVLGLIIAPIIGGVVKRVIDILKIDHLAQKMGVNDMVKGYSKKFSVSSIVGRLVKWFIILAFILAASDVMGWERVSFFLNDIILYIPQVLIAVIILVFGVIAGKFFDVIVTRSLSGSNTPVDNPETLGAVTRWAFIIFAVLAALVQLGIAPSLIEILFGGLVLAIALSFGLGGRDKAAELLDHIGTKKKK